MLLLYRNIPRIQQAEWSPLLQRDLLQTQIDGNVKASVCIYKLDTKPFPICVRVTAVNISQTVTV